MDKKHLLHKLMERRFGKKSCEASHKWLRSITGKCHVSDCSMHEVRKAVNALKRVGIVRRSVWQKLAAERKQSKREENKSVWTIYKNDGTKYRDFITCTTEGLADSQLEHNRRILGSDVVMIEFENARVIPREISFENMAKILEVKAHA